MLLSYFDIQPSPGATTAASTVVAPKAKAKAKRHGATRSRAKEAPPPVGRDADGTHVHAKFEPLPPETNVPRPAESSGQAWHGLSASVRRDDVMFRWQNDAADDVDMDDVGELGTARALDDMGYVGVDDDDEGTDQGDRMSDCQEYEVDESLEPALDFDAPTELTETDADSLGSSYDDTSFMASMFGTRTRASRESKDWSAAQGVPVYSGPQLFLDALDSDDE